MSDTRRTFLNSTMLGLAGSAALAAGQAQGSSPSSEKPATPLKMSADVQVPKMKFFGAEISRMAVGCNQFYGFGHYNNTLSTIMKEYYTPERVCEVLHQCNRFGINAFNYFPLGRAPQDLQRFEAEGGQMHLIVQGGFGDPEPMCKALKPLAIYYHGEMADQAFQKGAMSPVREWCKKVRDLGVVVGVGTHKPAVIALVEEQGWDVDFYAGCVYNRTRTVEEWKQVLNGELLEMPGEIYLHSDPPRMYKTMRQTRKPCFAFKIMAAGRIGDQGADQAFQTAFESIKPTDGIFVGMFPRAKDEVRENAERVHRLLVRS